MGTAQTGKELIDSIARSRERRASLLAKFGFIPESVLRLTRGALSRSMLSLQGERPARRANQSDTAIAKAERLKDVGMTRSASGVINGRGNAGLSIMAAELVDFFVKAYAKPGDVYIDPFMGHGIRMQVAKRNGLHYHGYDASNEFFDYISSIKSMIDDGKTTISITRGDSRFPTAIPDGAGDFSFYSPPYWDIEYYGDESEQLGKPGVTYEQFIIGMRDVARAWLPKFKAKCWHVVNVNDFRKDGKFYGYHSDLIAAYQRAGWTLHDIWIIDGLVGGMPRAFAVRSLLDLRQAPKVHEYAMVFTKGTSR
jgi:hypothetical protein